MATPSNVLNISQTGLMVFSPPASFLGRTLTAGAGISITNGNGVSGNPTISATGGTGTIGSIGVDTTTGAGTNPVVPTAGGLVTFTGGQYATGSFGTRVITINSPAANTLAVDVQIASTNSSTLITKNGVCHFNSAEFSVDANGFVSIATGGFTWNNIGASQTLVKQNGYFCSTGGALSLALPATSSVGDTIKVNLYGSTSWTITQAAGQQIRYGNVTTTLGAGGSLASNQQGDAVTIVCQAANTIWIVTDSIGGLTVT